MIIRKQVNAHDTWEKQQINHNNGMNHTNKNHEAVKPCQNTKQFISYLHPNAALQTFGISFTLY